MDDEEKLWRSQMREIGRVVAEYACLSLIEKRTKTQQEKWTKLRDEIVCDWELYPSIFDAVVDRYRKDVQKS